MIEGVGRHGIRRRSYYVTSGQCHRSHVSFVRGGGTDLLYAHFLGYQRHSTHVTATTYTQRGIAPWPVPQQLLDPTGSTSRRLTRAPILQLGDSVARMAGKENYNDRFFHNVAKNARYSSTWNCITNSLAISSPSWDWLYLIYNSLGTARQPDRSLEFRL